MKLSQAFLVCFCLSGATQLAWSQAKEPAAHAIPGTLDPATGKFTTRLGSGTRAHQNPEATTAATSILFREDFQISITNYDQPGSTAVCSVDMSSSGDTGDFFYEEQASVTASASGGTFSCDVPVLAQWSLQTPTMDLVSAEISVTVYTPGSSTGAYGTPTVYRSSSRSLSSLAQPSNGQTVVNKVSIVL